jgi:cytochrome c-type biogenesis protein CcmH/NrfG
MVTTTRRGIVVQGFFWALLASVTMLTIYFLVTGGPEKKTDREHGEVDVQQQIDRYKAVLADNPENIQVLIELGDLYLNTRNAHDAFQSFSTALELDPNNVHVLTDLASIHQQIGRYDQALENYQRAYELAPGHATTLLNMAMIYSRHKGDTAKALELLQQFLASNPEPQLAATAQQEIARIKQAGTPPSNNN